MRGGVDSGQVSSPSQGLTEIDRQQFMLISTPTADLQSPVNLN